MTTKYLACKFAGALLSPALAILCLLGSCTVAQSQVQPQSAVPTPTEADKNATPTANAPPSPTPTIRRGITRLAGKDPQFPRAAIRAGIREGKVVARIKIDDKGNVSEVIIVNAEPPSYFDQAAIDALKEWKFRVEGNDKYITEIVMKFKLD